MLIDRDKLLRLAKSERETCGKDYDFYGLLSDIEHAPTVDAMPVMHGRWIKGGYACGENEYKCSVCGETEWRTNCTSMRYCMHCGARMDDQSEKTT